MSGEVRVDHGTASGTFSLDGETHDVENNIWVVGDDEECVVIDAPHDVGAIEEVVDGREVIAVLATHAHDDHVRVAPELSDAALAPILLHPADEPVWSLTHPDRRWDGDLADGQVLEAGGHRLEVLHTPGHTPGGVSLHDAASAVVFSADTLFRGGPGATGRRVPCRGRGAAFALRPPAPAPERSAPRRPARVHHAATPLSVPEPPPYRLGSTAPPAARGGPRRLDTGLCRKY